MNLDEFPDQIHIEKIKKLLWSGREFGQASVMIGTGFSRNADKAHYSASPFPLWQKLADNMYDALYQPQSSDSTDKKLRAASGGGALKLASEYEIIFGRSALDNYLLQSIDDSKYIPSELHEKLLSLPWSDVFTTNYDTLLERTRFSVSERKYDLVETISDIPGKMKPRIVKLHGSFPSHRPFIITEEDFRTYPKKFAPFVNMVQQSIMENAFCLLGFSGDDPNFLCWSGWVRDNLGESKPPIYLCGLLKLSPSKRRLLESRGIIPIDLYPIVSERDLGPDDSHKEAIKWFLDELQKGEPPNILNWPVISDERALPPDTLNFDILKQTNETWHRKRMSYPGWVIAPKRSRDLLWLYTERWINPILQSVENLPTPENLFLLYELNWRLEKTLTPLSKNVAETLNKFIENINPFPSLLKIVGAKIRPDYDEFKSYNWKYIREYWVELAFALVRYSRENYVEDMFSLWINRLEKIYDKNGEWKARYFYEKCLFHLFRLDKHNVCKSLNDWPEINNLPFWETKKAYILVELGDFKNAEKIAKKALFDLRSQIHPYSSDCLLLSQEGWTMLLLNKIKINASLIEKRDLEADYGNPRDKNRWDKLETYKCNPDTEIELLSLSIKGEPTILRVNKEIQNTFDGGVKVKYRFQQDLNALKIPYFSLFRLFEEAAVPVKCGYASVFNSVFLADSAKRTIPHNLYWPLNVMMRNGNRDEIDKWFDRTIVGTLTQEEVDYLGNLLISSLKTSLKDLEVMSQNCNLNNNDFSERMLDVVSEVLSRLCIHFSSKQLAQLYELTLEMYNSSLIRQEISLYDNLKHLFQRILYTMSQVDILERIPSLLSLPVPNENGFKVRVPELWVEPLRYIIWSDNSTTKSDFDRTSWNEPIENLLRVIKLGTSETRDIAILRLGKIYEINALTEEENKSLASLLQEKVDLMMDFSNESKLYSYSFLANTDGKKIKNMLLSDDFPHLKHSTNPDGSPRVSITLDEVQYINGLITVTEPLFPWVKKEEKKYLDWTSDEIEQLVNKTLYWWDECKNYLQKENVSYFSRSLRSKFVNLPSLVSLVILPRLRTEDVGSKIKIKRLLDEMEESEINILWTLPMLLFIDSDISDQIVSKLRIGLNSTNEEEISDSTSGIFCWVLLGNMKKVSSPPINLVEELVNRVISSRQPGLNFFIDSLSRIIKRCPEIVSDEQIESLCFSLEYLIKETELPNRKEIENIASMKTVIPLIDRWKYRRLSAQLAHCIFTKLDHEGKEIPQIITDWRSVCLKDPFPEVRKAWSDV